MDQGLIVVNTEAPAKSRDSFRPVYRFRSHFLKVDFQHTTTSTSVIAVKIDDNSTFEAESTSFSGFDDEVRS